MAQALGLRNMSLAQFRLPPSLVSSGSRDLSGVFPGLRENSDNTAVSTQVSVNFDVIPEVVDYQSQG